MSSPAQYYFKRGDSMAIILRAAGDFRKTFSFLERCKEVVHLGDLDRYGRMGVEALRQATPKDTGKTAASWNYRITRGRDSASIEWVNSNIVDGVPIAVILQYGHGTRNGGYVQGRDYINPALQPVFDQIAKEAWKEVAR